MGTGRTPAHLTLADSGSHVPNETGTLHAPLLSCYLSSRSSGISPWTSDITHSMYSMRLLGGCPGDGDEAKGLVTRQRAWADEGKGVQGCKVKK